MTLCYLGIGSNLRTPERQLRLAIPWLQKMPRSVVTQVSSLYFSKPCGLRAQPPYCNAVIAVHTSLSARHLLECCFSIENNMQRLRKKPKGARTLDIDVLLYGKQIINNPTVTVPHPHLLERDFVLVPLLEIAPHAQLPNGEAIISYLTHCETYLFKSKFDILNKEPFFS